MSRASVSRILIFLLFSATFIMATSAHEEKPLAEHWKRTGLKARDLETLISDKNCRKNDRAFMSCVSLLSAMIPAGTRLVPFDPELGEDVVKRVGVAALVKDEPGAPAGASELLRKVKERRENTRARWLSLRKSKSLSFAVIFAELRAGIEASIVESETAAKAYNAFLEFYNDPHTYILPTAYVQRESQARQESFVGIGIQLGRLGSYPLVQSLLSGGPAARAGLRRNDLILSIDGQETGRLSLEEASKKLKGGPGTKVSLLVWRDTYPVEVEVQRDELKKTNVESRMIDYGGVRLKYIRVASFMRNELCNDVVQTLMLSEDASGIVLDLRDNGGGLVDGAICLASAFLPSGKAVVRVKELTGGGSETYKSRGGSLTKLPTVVLVNSGSASASEIVAGALQDHERAWIVGERTWGKGTVQQSEVWEMNDRVLLFKTVARYYLPGGRSIQKAGIIPDVTAFEAPSVREEDLAGSIFPAEGRVSARKLPERLKACLEARGSLNRARAGEEDPQLGVAADVLDCSAGM